MSDYVESCGCLMTTNGGLRAKRVYGFRRHPFYSSWQNICQRTSNPKNDNWKHYGEKGIGICIQWRMSFLSFLESMPEKRDQLLTIDRIENHKGYCPHNIRMATLSEQNSNKSSNGKHGRCIYWHNRDQRYYAYMQVSGRRIHIGSFRKRDEARSEFIKNFYEWFGKLPYGVKNGKKGKFPIGLSGINKACGIKRQEDGRETTGTNGKIPPKRAVL